MEILSQNSARKIRFQYHHTKEMYIEAIDDAKTEHISCLTKVDGKIKNIDSCL